MNDKKMNSFTREIRSSVIRMELQLKGKLENKLGFQPSLRCLMVKENYNHLADILCDYYTLIEKKSVPIISPEIILNTKELEKLIFKLGINSIGGSNTLKNFLAPAKVSGEISRKVFKRLMDLSEYESSLVSKSELIKEMDEEFLRTVTSLMI